MTIRQHLDRLPFEIKDRLMALRETQLSNPSLAIFITENLDGNPDEDFIEDLYDSIRAALRLTDPAPLTDEERLYWGTLGMENSPLLEIGKHYQSVAGRIFLITEHDFQRDLYEEVCGRCAQNGETKYWSRFGEEASYWESELGSQLILRPVEAPAPPVIYAWVKPGPEKRALILD